MSTTAAPTPSPSLSSQLMSSEAQSKLKAPAKKDKATSSSSKKKKSVMDYTLPTPSKWMRRLIHLIVHALCIQLYMGPILQDNLYGGPTLDEIHIMSADNKDINGEDTTLRTIFTNDYWGRPMVSESSHKSWRPFTVLSFRYLKGYTSSSELTVHRFVNVITHACTADVVGVLATKLFTTVHDKDAWLLHVLVKLVFILHPTHIEVTANAANRNHILAALCSTMLCDPSLNLLWYLLVLVSGFLVSETFLFQVPAILVTLTVIVYRQVHYHPSLHHQSVFSTIWKLILSIIAILPRVIFAFMATAAYIFGRYYFDTLSIPEGLIRPAENPFFTFSGMHRVRNYAYILAIHMSKSWGFDPIGFSHEYGFDCIPEIKSWNDTRLYLPIFFAVVMTISLLMAFTYKPADSLGYVAVHWAWLLTLFPISGIVKVGTFVADRIVVASTVSVSIWIGVLLYYWSSRWIHSLPAKPLQCMFVGWILAVSVNKIHNRTLQWMDPISLLSSSLQVCPRYAKAHLEISKIYSGLYPELLALDQSSWHINQAMDIDPDFCDVHQQFAHVAIQQSQYMTYEQELMQAILCPFTMGGALEMWKRYWEIATNSGTPEQIQQAQERNAEYTRQIQIAVQEAQRKEEEKERLKQQEKKNKKGSPFVWGSGEL